MNQDRGASTPPSSAEDSGVGRGSRGMRAAQTSSPRRRACRKGRPARSKGRTDLRIPPRGGGRSSRGGRRRHVLVPARPGRRSPRDRQVGPSLEGTPPRQGTRRPSRPFQKAQALFEHRKDRRGNLPSSRSCPDWIRAHNQALVRIEKIKSSTAPTPGPAAPSTAQLDDAYRRPRRDVLKRHRRAEEPGSRRQGPPQDAEAAAAAQRAHEQVGP